MGLLPGVAGAEGFPRGPRFLLQRSRFCDRNKHRNKHRNKLGPPLATLAVVGVVFGVLAGFSASASANDVQGRGDPIAELRNYVQLAAAAQPDTTAAEDANQASSSVARGEFADDAYAALRAFTQRIAANPPQSIKDQPKLADADGLFSAIKQLMDKGNGEQPPSPAGETPKAPAAPPAKAKGASRRSDLCGIKSLFRLPRQRGRTILRHAHGPAAQAGQAAMRNLPRARLGPCESRRRARRGRDHLVPER